MAKRSHTLIFTFVLTTTIMLFPSTARLQEKAASPESAAQEKGSYIIKKGDTLWDIAHSALKDPFLWPLIWKENPSITNPDLIYPGNSLAIPSLAPIERAMRSPAEAAPTTARKATAEPMASTASEKAVNIDPKAVAPAQEEASVTSGLILDKEIARPLIDKYTMVSAGYVSADTLTESIVGSLEPKVILGADDIVFIKVGTPENVKIGDKYQITAPVKNVKHPKTGKKMGSLTKVLGILQVIEKAPGATYLTARISLSFEGISKGALLAPYQEPASIFSIPKNDGRTIDGHIIEVMDSRTIVGNYDIIFLDKGSSDGVKPGDRFTIFIDAIKKGFPKKIIAEAMVIKVKDTTATALVKNSSDSIAKGDGFELIK